MVVVCLFVWLAGCLVGWLGWLVVVQPFPFVPDVPASLCSFENYRPFVARPQQKTHEKEKKIEDVLSLHRR